MIETNLLYAYVKKEGWLKETASKHNIKDNKARIWEDLCFKRKS